MLRILDLVDGRRLHSPEIINHARGKAQSPVLVLKVERVRVYLDDGRRSASKCRHERD